MSTDQMRTVRQVGGRNIRNLTSGILKEEVVGGVGGWIVILPCAADGKSMVQNCVYEMLSFCLKGKNLYTFCA